MNNNALRFLHRHSIPVTAALAALLGGCAVDTYGPPPGPTVPELAGTRWTVTSIDGHDTARNTDLTADFSVDGRVTGDSGCNHFSGPFIQTGATVNFGELLSTRRDCSQSRDRRQEDRMLDIMHGATTVRLAHDGELSLRGSAGMMTFVHATATDSVAAVDSGTPRREKYDCQGVQLTVEYSSDNDVVRLTWPDGSDVLRRHPGDGSVIDYRSDLSEWRVDRDTLWGREGSAPRHCTLRS